MIRFVRHRCFAKWAGAAPLVVLLSGFCARAQVPGTPPANPPISRNNDLPITLEPLTLQVAKGYHTVAFSVDGKRLGSVGPGKALVWGTWGASNGKELLALPSVPETFDVSFSPDGKWIAAATRAGAKLWNAANAQEVFTTRGQSWVNRVAFSSDSKRLACAGSPGIKIWEVPTGREICTIPGDRTWESCAVFSPDGKRLASGNANKTVKIWDAANGQQLVACQGHTGAIYTVAFSPDGKRLASASADKTIKLWDAKTGQMLLSLSGHTSKVNSVAFSPEGKILVSGGGDKTMKFWDAATGRELLSVPAHTGDVYSAVYSPDGFRLASTGNDGLVKLWSLGTPHPPGVALSAEDLQTLWGDLMGEQVLKKTRAILVLAAAHQQTVPFLKSRLRQATLAPAQTKHMADLIAKLNHDSFSVRHQATKALEKLGKAAEPALRLSLREVQDLEKRRRVEQLLYKLQSAAPSMEQLEAELATEVLERIGTQEARAALSWLAQGAPEGWITQEARASLERLPPLVPGP